MNWRGILCCAMVLIDDLFKRLLAGKGQFGRVFLATETISSTLKAIKVLDVSTSRREYNWTWLTREERDSATKDMDIICDVIDNLPGGVVKEHFSQAYSTLREKLKAEENPQRRKTRRPVAEREILLHVSPNPFVSNLETSFFEGSNLFMVFNYYPGGTLQDLLDVQPEGRLDPETARVYASELVIALEFLRDNNIAHRDVKPENMLLDEQGHIALSDFGLATRLQGGLKTFCGTAEYVAPEVLSEVTWKSTYLDWWAFGVTLYQMLSGRTPFGGSKDAATVFLNTLTAPLVFPEEFPEDAKSLLEGILNRDYSKRILPEDIRDHRYFSGVDFNELKKKLFPAPMIPATRRRRRPKSSRRPRPRIEVSFDFV